MKLSTSIVCHLLMLALAVTTQVVNGKKIIVNCRVIIPYFLLHIASFLFDDTCVIHHHYTKPSQLRIVYLIAIVILISAAEFQRGSIVVWSNPHMTNA
jgi:hypothetical protein